MFLHACMLSNVLNEDDNKAKCYRKEEEMFKNVVSRVLI